jgi:hypothetical protein
MQVPAHDVNVRAISPDSFAERVHQRIQMGSQGLLGIYLADHSLPAFVHVTRTFEDQLPMIPSPPQEPCPMLLP